MIPLFPEHVLDNSLHTAILVGLLFTWALHEALGSVFAGFVVAGYLAALGVAAPASLVVVLVEAILCYGLVWILGVGLPRLGLYSRVFGRERFLLFVLLALPVRLLVTGVAMPNLEAHLEVAGLTGPHLGLGLFGVGVVLVPLTANTFWKVGITRGLIQLSVTGGLTWLVVTQGLARATNFRFGDFEHTFDALAVSAWESSRVVLVLICTVFVAARNNLRFGWDFGGILVPALLAMLVFDPVKYVATVAEVVVLYTLYEALIRLPGIRSLDLEGPRRIVSIFACSYAWKWLLALWFGSVGLGVPLSDVFGFGYLLTSLVVARAHHKGAVLPILVPLTATSLQGALLSLPLAVLLGLTPWGAAPASGDARPVEGAPLVASLELQAAAGAIVDGPSDAPPRIGPDDVVPGQPCRTQPPVPGDPAAPGVVTCGGDGPVLVIPLPRGEPIAWWGATLLDAGNASAVVIASTDPSLHPTRSGQTDAVVAATLDAAQALAGERAVLVLHAGAWQRSATLYLRDPEGIADILTALPEIGLRLDTGPLPADVLGWWHDLRTQDGVLRLAPDSLPPSASLWPLPLADAVALPDGGTADLDLFVEAVLPSLLFAARAAPEGTAPDALQGLLHAAGARLVHAEADDGSVHWVVSAAGPTGTERLILRPGGAPTVVLASRAQAWPGITPIALHHHLELGAEATWLDGRRDGMGLDTAPADGGPSPLDRRIRALLAPTPEWPEGRTVHVLEVAATGESVHASDGNEVIDLAALEPHAASLGHALGTWPGWRTAGPLRPEDARRRPTLGYAVRYQEAIAPDRILVTWFPVELLREPRGTADRAARLAWYRAAHIPIRAADTPAAVAQLVPMGDPISVPQAQAPLLQHAHTPTDATLGALLALDGWTVSVLDTPLRLVVLAERDRLVCTAVAGAAGPPVWPWSGCWTRP